MGFSSFLTSDTKESIWNVYTGRSRTVYMLQPNGLPPIEEKAYQGYMVFGGVDVFEWIARINNLAGLTSDEEYRNAGLNLLYDEERSDGYFMPRFSFDKNAIYEDLPDAEFCPYQGFFSDEEAFSLPD